MCVCFVGELKILHMNMQEHGVQMFPSHCQKFLDQEHNGKQVWSKVVNLHTLVIRIQ